MKTYNVIWTERHSVTIEANSADEATIKAHEGNYNEGLHSAELDGQPEAYEIKQ